MFTSQRCICQHLFYTFQDYQRFLFGNLFFIANSLIVLHERFFTSFSFLATYLRLLLRKRNYQWTLAANLWLSFGVSLHFGAGFRKLGIQFQLNSCCNWDGESGYHVVHSQLTTLNIYLECEQTTQLCSSEYPSWQQLRETLNIQPS